jgi:hypothetical protein
MKKIFLSLVTIVMVSALAVQATQSYFTDGLVLGANEFSTGTVDLNENNTANFPIKWTNIAPGGTYEKTVSIRYLGSLNADLYLGVNGTSKSTDDQYLADFLWLKIEDANNTSAQPLFNNYAKYLSANWYKIATNIPANYLNNYKLTFSMSNDIGNDKQGVKNTDTYFMVYAVETGGTKPKTLPMNTLGDDFLKDI